MADRISALRSILALCRVSNLPTVWMNVLTATVLTGHAIGREMPSEAFLLLAAALSGFYCGGMSFNDLCDRDWDAERQPFRPIPSGRVTVATARAVTVILFGGGLALLWLTPDIRGLAAGFFLLVVIFLYDRYHKRHPGTVLLMAAARLMIFVVCAQALAGRVTGGVWVAGGAQFVYTLLITAVARHEYSRGVPYRIALIPNMIAGMAVLDGSVLAVLVAPAWLGAGVAAALLTRFAQHFVRGD
jgi:4-hydroxybenzoate polyprenyltransferase